MTAPDRLLVYRVQDDSGRGPYRPGFSHWWTDPGHNERNPAIFADFPALNLRSLPSGPAYGCGFRDLEQLAEWFSGRELKRLSEFGYRVVRLEVDAVIAESLRQLIFARLRPLRDGAELLEGHLMPTTGRA